MTEPTNANHIALDPNFVDDAKNRLLSQFENSTNINTIVEIEASRFKTLDDAAYELAIGRLLENAAGVNLDNIGNSLGIPRNGLSDPAYRQSILFKTYSTNLSPTRDELHNFVSTLSGGYPDLTTFHTSTDANNTVSITSCYKYVDTTFYPNCMTDAGLEDLKSAFPVITTVYPLGKELFETFGCIALDGSNNEVSANQSRVRGLAALNNSNEVVATEQSGSLSVFITSLTGIENQYAIDFLGDDAEDTEGNMAQAPTP